MRQLILFTLLTLEVLNIAYGEVNCNCKYHKGGCAINIAAPRGFKCKCNYKGFWTCTGVPFPCKEGENCAAGRTSYCACKLGGGNCGGYKRKTNDCSSENTGTHTNTVTNNVDCNCKYHSGGCSIHIPAPKDHKCVCTYKGFWTCQGWAQGCSSNEHCPGGDYTYCGCKLGGGNCGAYSEARSDPKGDKCDFSKPKPRTCDCNRNSDWGKSSYMVTNVDYDMKKMERSNIRPEALGTQDVPNRSDATQSIQFWVSKSLSSTSSFTHTSGISISVGASFTAKFPLGEASASFTVDTSTSYAWGESKTVSLSFSHRFTCNGPPKQQTRCEVSVQRADVIIPYTMTLTHKEIPNCKCESKGIWRGITAFDQTLKAYKIKNLN